MSNYAQNESRYKHTISGSLIVRTRHSKRINNIDTECGTHITTLKKLWPIRHRHKHTDAQTHTESVCVCMSVPQHDVDCSEWVDNQTDTLTASNWSCSIILANSRSTSTIKHTTNAHHFVGSVRVGGFDLWILMMTLIGFMSWFGGCISANSISVIPAYTSHKE